MFSRVAPVVAVAVVAAIAAIAAAGCLVETPQERDPAVQGDYEDGDEEHRPGQPCLLCHGEGHFPLPPGGEQFQVAGTVYAGIDDFEDDGLEGVDVIITDADGVEVTAVSNRAGNFMIEVDSGVDAPTPRNKGRLRIPRPLVFPLTVRIQRGADAQEMETRMWRNGSCAHCHGPAPGADSVGRVYLLDEAAP
jgi:cytochrome c5